MAVTHSYVDLTYVMLKVIQQTTLVLYLSHAYGSNSIETLETTTMQSLNCSVLPPPRTIGSVRSEKESQDFPAEMFPPGFFVVHNTTRCCQHKEPAQTFQTFKYNSETNSKCSHTW